MITVSEYFVFYPHTKITSSDIGIQYLPFAQNWVQSKLAPMFVLPFSDNNLTYTQIVYMKAWHQTLLRTRDPLDSEEVGDRIDLWIKELLSGDAAMVTSGGTAIFADAQNANTSEEVVSNTANYAPIFDMDNALESRVDPDRLDDIESERG